MVYRIYVEKKPVFASEAAAQLHELAPLVSAGALQSLRIINRYDVEGVSEDVFTACHHTVFAEPQLDDVYLEMPGATHVFAIEPLPGQYDQRADSCEQCVQIIAGGEKPTVKTARVYLMEGDMTPEDIQAIQAYLINPVESRIAALELPETLREVYPTAPDEPVLHGFTAQTPAQLEQTLTQLSLAMDLADITYCQAYFKEEGREPTLAEIRVLDTYWSDHCRHTTFNTQLSEVDIQDALVQSAFDAYLKIKEELYPGEARPLTLMDLATIGGKYLRAKGKLEALDVSDEINACSVKLKVDVGGQMEDWLLMFKNETHNHPTEIEPFGGAATCIGGAIRDPLSGRSYVYQAMRVTGAGDPLTPLSETLPGKLPQRKIVQTAAAGYSAYGNQIGLPTGLVQEVYHPGYVAKRMELGAVIAAAPQENVVRETPAAGDVVVLLGGRTGRDGLGGATGSSKGHNAQSLESCGAEVQKGNAPEERKIQRLFRNPTATRLIKRCNDFGAGGVSVAIGELADGLDIQLDAVPKKYEGLTGAELALSESQERMAVVLAAGDAEKFIALAAAENLEATVVATVTTSPRLVMHWRGQEIVNISRAFLDTNGAPKFANASVPAYAPATMGVPAGATAAQKLQTLVQDLNVAGQVGLTQRFDSTVGGGAVLFPLGGEQMLTPVQAMVSKLPVLAADTTTVSGMAFAFNPYLLSENPYAGAYLAVVESVAKLIATGFTRDSMHLSFQEFFERLGQDETRWGKPFAALLGGLRAQLDLEVAAIGGKDSMSGSFEDIHVPPTLVSFAVGSANINNIVANPFKKAGTRVVLLAPSGGLVPNSTSLIETFDAAQELLRSGAVSAAWAVGYGGVAEGLFKMGLGNRIGFAVEEDAVKHLFGYRYGAFVMALADDAPVPANAVLLGHTTAEYTFSCEGEQTSMAALQELYEEKLAPIYPYRRQPQENLDAPMIKPVHNATAWPTPKIGVAKPKATIMVFPGTNCEYDVARGMEKAGITPEIFVVRNLSSAAIAQSVQELSAKLATSQILFIPGGFSAGDEPDGSGKFITAFFRNPALTQGVRALLQQQDGLVGGICNGFQALIKLGLVPYGDITSPSADAPTLAFNAIGRHQNRLVRTRIASNKSPWFSKTKPGEVYTIALSHGEGRLVPGPGGVDALAANGQIATQYVDLAGEPTMELAFNPNTSFMAVEGITSADGRVFGKMGHHERYTPGNYKNVQGEKVLPLFEGAAAYYGI
ncbi:phosphoribosylformylglycinamidine synthase [Ruminococcaceae bacterium OttesenSCG-928-N02]|nr:phosphoribosylformylglycinamidine synthase [Ruminococcaceae bacterium OttesenSCG-928-N02]